VARVSSWVWAVGAVLAGCNFRLEGLPIVDVPDDLAGVPADLALATGDLASPPPTFSTLALLAGSGNAGYLDGSGAAAKFNNPNGLAVDATGTLYVADTSNAVVRKIDGNAQVSTLAGQQGAQNEMDGAGTQARFNQPEAVATDASGNVWVTDAGAGTIRRIVVATGAVTTFAGDGNNGFADGIGTGAQLNQPRGIIADAAGNLYVSDASNQLIRRIVVATAAVSTLAGGVGQAGFVDGGGSTARFNQPRGLALDGAGTLYVADSGNNAIRAIVLATGAVNTLAGSGMPGITDGSGTAAQFNQPRGVVADGLGNLYVADTNNSMIRKIVLSTAAVTTFAGVAGSAMQQLGPLPGKVDDPWGIVALPSSGALVYTDVMTADVVIIR
jgi:sugar lactone lactonase YvrE